MEHKSSEIFKEQLKMEMVIKTEVETAATSTVQIDSHSVFQINLNHLKQEPALVQCVKSEPVLLVKEEILMDISQDGNEQQFVQVTFTPADAGSGNEACGTSEGALLHVKQELGEIDIGPTVLQHMDSHYTMSKNSCAVIEESSIVDDYNEAMLSAGVKKENAEDKLIGSIAPQKATMNERRGCSTLQNPQLAAHRDNLESICRVNLMRLDTFQCELCNAVYTEKHWLLQHLNSVHGFNLQTSLLVKCHEANKRSTAEHKKPHVRNSMTSMTTGSAVAGSTHTGERSYQCDTCDARFARNGALTRHVKMHTREKTFQCNPCDAKFTQSSTLTTHMRDTGEKPSQCNTCDAIFPPSDLIMKHARVHTGEKRYQCNMCDTKFAQSSGLSTHMRIHTGEKPYQCNTCHARFARGDSLAKHLRVHTGEKPYQCNICNTRFAESSSLATHKRIHTGEKPYQCNTCDVRFARSSSLTMHVRVHTGEKPFQCNRCDAKFSQNGALTMHMRVHTGEKPYQCNACDAKFTQSSALTTHMRVHTGQKPYQCNTCDARFAHSGALTKHARVHIIESVTV